MTVARDALIAKRYDYSSACLALEQLNKTLQASSRVDVAAGSRNLVKVFGDHATWLYQLIHRKSGFVRPHREKVATVHDGEIHTIKSSLSRPIPQLAPNHPSTKRIGR